MNRRSFLGKVGTAAAVVPAGLALARTVVQAEPSSATGDVLLAPESNAADPAVVDTSAAPSWWDDRFEVLSRRGLLHPCPNCLATAWNGPLTRHMTCGQCGWATPGDRLMLPCPCTRCWSGNARPAGLVGSATRAQLLADLPPGAYAVVDERGRPILQMELNSYDICSDRYLHHVTTRQVAGVLCAVKMVLNAGHRPMSGDRMRRADGNLVFFTTEILDSLEARQDRGEAPRRWFHRCQCGHLTIRDVFEKASEFRMATPTIVCEQCGRA